ncbi:MAG: hypothetical protein IIC87_05270 [Chloroflexi bacterium]|nr:hypothetical protein [Chloroflexota bacterium]
MLASNVVRELSAGKGFLFSDQGDIVLRGFEDPVRLYEAPGVRAQAGAAKPARRLTPPLAAE